MVRADEGDADEGIWVAGVSGLQLGAFRWMQSHFRTRMNTPSFGGISFGRTSAVMHALMTGQPWYYPHFENTGREDNRTLEFGNELNQATGNLLRWSSIR